MRVITLANQIGVNFKARRKALGLSQAKLAERLNLSQNRISELENHPEKMTVQQMLGLANLLGLEFTISERKAESKSEW